MTINLTRRTSLIKNIKRFLVASDLVKYSAIREMSVRQRKRDKERGRRGREKETYI